jgi:sulfur carrier protein ThiS
MVTVKLRDKIFEINAGSTILSSLMKLGILPETVLAIQDGEMLTEDIILKDGETITLIEVISGG